MTEEEHYIIYGHSQILTKDEKKTISHLNAKAKIDNSTSQSMKRMLEKRMLVEGPEIDHLLRDGSELFFKRTVERIKKEEQDKLNKCPKCNSICRTIEACICPSCNHTWFEERRETT